MADFILFGTAGCHLCEEAEQLLAQAGLTFDKQDILADEQFLQRYGVRIPVVLHSSSGWELDWPFSVEMAREFVAKAIAR